MYCRNTDGQLKKYMDNKIKNLSTNQTYMIVHGQLSEKESFSSYSGDTFFISKNFKNNKIYKLNKKNFKLIAFDEFLLFLVFT
ncbi:hypothetical protein BpHYR1_001625 [Brachionus plicatilis]|uniref:Uncharacterized protein n=1 Tax=Brachionus plicatilis TaxID=10195 RepID=A0A3M7PLA0_BRAPC|nr:hypothetical protein BpHYR1_001625 [Brachionus plicatilis]